MTKFNFGKHKGKTFEEVYNNDKQYIKYLKTLTPYTEDVEKNISKFLDFCDKKISDENKQKLKQEAKEEKTYNTEHKECEYIFQRSPMKGIKCTGKVNKTSDNYCSKHIDKDHDKECEYIFQRTPMKGIKCTRKVNKSDNYCSKHIDKDHNKINSIVPLEIYKEENKMTHICNKQISICAIDKNTNKIVLPCYANKLDKYICTKVDCNKEVVFCKGDIRKPYFRHKSDKSNIKCTLYDKPSESDIHFQAKIQIKELIEREKKIKFYRDCCECGNKEDIVLYLNNKQAIDTEIVIDELNHRADVAVYEKGNKQKIFYIIEVFHTHKTSEQVRFEPWFEINAKSFLQKVQTHKENNLFEIECIRVKRCFKCDRKKVLEEHIKNKIKTDEKKLDEYLNDIILKTLDISNTHSYFEEIKKIEEDSDTDREHKDLYKEKAKRLHLDHHDGITINNIEICERFSFFSKKYKFIVNGWKGGLSYFIVPSVGYKNLIYRLRDAYENGITKYWDKRDIIHIYHDEDAYEGEGTRIFLKEILYQIINLSSKRGIYWDGYKKRKLTFFDFEIYREKMRRKKELQEEEKRQRREIRREQLKAKIKAEIIQMYE